MNRNRNKFMTQMFIIVAVTLIAASFVASILIINSFAERECFDNIEETTKQISDMFTHAMEQSRTQLDLFADILSTNESNPDELLTAYMKNFCETQNFSAVCIHRLSGNSLSYGAHPHDEVGSLKIEDELEKIPYVSDAIFCGDTRSESYIYQAVPVVRDGATVAIVYGYISLDTFPSFISSTAYDGNCEFYIVDGNTGDYLMDEYHKFSKDDTETEIPLSNVFDGSMGDRETKPGYDMETMRSKINQGESGYFIFKSQRTGYWYYMYFMPMGINNWSIQLTIDEPTAFAEYNDVKSSVSLIMMCVIILALGIVAALMLQNSKSRKRDKENLRKTDYINSVQSALITAHNNPDFVHQALKLVAKELGAEKAILLTFSNNIVSNIYYWPSLDMNKATRLIGINFREEFPVFYDKMISDESCFCDEKLIEARFTPIAKALFRSLFIYNILLVPVLDNTSVLRGTIATLNMQDDVRSPDMIRLVTSDFFMAISNLENHNTIKNMGTIDYLTGVRNRNSYETEFRNFSELDAESLWCAYIDVNGLHEVNNTQGHEAGDLMLKTVAKVIKNVFGDKWVYRLGGDEFVAFAADSSHGEFMIYKRRIMEDLSQRGYYVSVGFEGAVKNEHGVFDVDKIVKGAETIMYKEKKEYYETNHLIESRNRLSIPNSSDT